MTDLKKCKEAYSFLAELITKMNTQGNRMTAAPYLFTIRNPIRIYNVSKDDCDGHEWYHEEDFESTADSDEELIAKCIDILKEALDEISKDPSIDNIYDLETDDSQAIINFLLELGMVNEVDCFRFEEGADLEEKAKQLLTFDHDTIADLAESLGYTQGYYRKEYEYKNVFFTEDAAKAHLEQNHYHFNKGADTYVDHCYRNPEMKKLFESIGEIVGVPYERK